MPSKNPLLRALRRLGGSTPELESEEPQRVGEPGGGMRISELRDRQVVQLRGTITKLTMTPRGGGTQWLEAEFTDGSGTLTLIWMGRREIPGVVAGRQLSVSGRVSCVDGQRRLYNPIYELIAS